MCRELSFLFGESCCIFITVNVSVSWVRAGAFLVYSLCIPGGQGRAWHREKPSDDLGNECMAGGVSGPFKDEKAGRQQGLHSGKPPEPLPAVGSLREALGPR